MGERKDSRQQGDAGGAAAPRRAGKRAYHRPEFVEYGSVAKLTKGTKSVNADGTTNQQKQKVCL
jgi:hypothetical protein